MNIIVPMNGNDIDESKICLINDAKFWLYFEMNEGKMQNEKFYDKKEDIKEYIDIAVVADENDSVFDLMQDGIAILVAPIQKYVEDIVEAYLFKELHDLTI